MYTSKKAKNLMLQAMLFASSLTLVHSTQTTYAQSPATNDAAGQISMAILPVQKGEDGQQYIITKAGYKVSVPGLGIAPDAKEVAVYRDGANNYWYVDRKGTTQKVTHDQLQWTMAQINQQQAAKGLSGAAGTSNLKDMATKQGMPLQTVSPTQMATGQPTPNVIVQNTVPGQYPYPTNGSSAMVTGAAAMGGAMAGSAMVNSMYDNNNGYHGIPYGTPCYNEGGQRYYYGANGARVPIAADTNNQYLNQWNNQRPYEANRAVRDAQEVTRDVEMDTGGGFRRRFR
jgi:hypothetical protein